MSLWSALARLVKRKPPVANQEPVQPKAPRQPFSLNAALQELRAARLAQRPDAGSLNPFKVNPSFMPPAAKGPALAMDTAFGSGGNEWAFAAIAGMGLS